MSYELFGPDNKFANIFSGLNMAKTCKFDSYENVNSCSSEEYHCSSQRSFSPEIKEDHRQSEDALFFKFLLSEEERAASIQEDQMKKLQSEMETLLDNDNSEPEPSKNEIKKMSFEHVPFPVFSSPSPSVSVHPPMLKPIHPRVTLTMLPQKSSAPIPKYEPTKKILLELKNPRPTFTNVPVNNTQNKPKKILLELRNPFPRRVFSSVYDI